MKKLDGLNFLAQLFIVSIVLIFPSNPSHAYAYDHFISKGINTSLWVDIGPNTGLFSQPGDGYLYFNDSSGGQQDRLRSYNRVSGPFTVRINYSNFQASNDQPAGSGRGSSVILILGDSTNSVGVLEYKNAGGLGFQAQSYLGGITTSLNYSITNVTRGWLGIQYNGVLGSGGLVSFWYNSGAGWTKLATYAPNFSNTPYFTISGRNTYGTALTFQVDQVQILPFNPSLPFIIPLLLEPSD